jgi:hypothetical protein
MLHGEENLKTSTLGGVGRSIASGLLFAFAKWMNAEPRGFLGNYPLTCLVAFYWA